MAGSRIVPVIIHVPVRTPSGAALGTGTKSFAICVPTPTLSPYPVATLRAFTVAYGQRFEFDVRIDVNPVLDGVAKTVTVEHEGLVIQPTSEIEESFVERLEDGRTKIVRYRYEAS